MTLKEVCKELGYKENTLKRTFNRTVQNLRNKGIILTKEGIGEKANYTIIYDESLIPPKKIKLHDELVGQKFNHLTVLRDSGERYKRGILWECQCDCGRIHKVTTNHLTMGRIKTCGKLDCPYHTTYEDLTDKKFGHLTALYPTFMKDKTHMYWMCKCDCGNPDLKEVASCHLKRGSVTSCGCVKTSIGEANIEKILKANNIIYQTQVNFKDLKNVKPLRYDFGIYQNGQLIRLIEFDGIQHFQEQKYFTHNLTETKISDKLKNDYAKEHNIPLVRIPYYERDKMTLEMIMGDKYLI